MNGFSEYLFDNLLPDLLEADGKKPPSQSTSAPTARPAEATPQSSVANEANRPTAVTDGARTARAVKRDLEEAERDVRL